jgi:hypothetical protein
MSNIEKLPYRSVHMSDTVNCQPVLKSLMLRRKALSIFPKLCIV